MQGKKKMRLGDLLINQGILTEIQLQAAIEKQKITGEKLGIVLTDMGITTEMEIAKALQRQLEYQIVQLSGLKINPEILKLVSDVSFLKKNVMIPFDFLPGKAGIYVAMSDPMNIMAIDDLALVTNMRIRPVIGTTSDIMAAIDKYYGKQENAAVADAYAKEQGISLAQTKENSVDSAGNAPIVILIKSMIEQAVRQRASDIHIEPLESHVRIRTRVDGSLIETATYPLAMLSAIVARIKIIAGLDISEKRKPQDGRMTQVVNRQEYDIRVSTIPVVYGEKVVLRLATKNLSATKKEELGLCPEDLKILDRMLKKPYGMILVTGPTGSGKSTTLYTALCELNTEDVNIVTVEDPVEANIDGINQIQVNTKADMTFASALRAILRQDPDVIMIGEIRDTETASIAVSASITGHLVVSTLHTNNAASSIMRLVDMDVEPYLIADATIGVIAQRLVKRLCDCKKPRRATAAEKRALEIPQEIDLLVQEPKGCEKCNNTGFLGRVGVYEIMEITDALHSAITRGANAKQISDIALAEGMRTLKMSATRLVLEGLTTVEEMKRVSYATLDGEEDENEQE